MKQSTEVDSLNNEVRDLKQEIKRQAEMLIESKEENDEIHERLNFTEQQLIIVKQQWAEAECEREQYLN